MSKNHRGKGIADQYRKGRGTCPICKRTSVKITHEREIDKVQVKVCKICNVTLTKKEELLKKEAKTETKETTAAATETTTEEG